MKQSIGRWLGSCMGALCVFLLVGCDGGGGTVSSAPVITSQPTGVTVPAGQTASFSVAATGSPSPSYQWKRNGVNIAGATSATYVTPALALSDGGASYSVAVSNSAGSVASSNAALGVSAVTTAEKKSLLSLLALTYEFYLTAVAPIELVDSTASPSVFVDPALMCLSGSMTGSWNGGAVPVGQPVPDNGTLAGTFNTCSPDGGITIYDGSSALTASLTSVDPLNGSITAAVNNMRMRHASGGSLDLDLSANGSGTAMLTSSVNGSAFAFALDLGVDSGSTLTNGLSSLTATFATGSVSFSASDDGAGLRQFSLGYNNLHFSISGVDYVADGTYTVTRDAGGNYNGSGEVTLTSDGAQVGRLFAGPGGQFMEADGSVQGFSVRGIKAKALR